MTEAEWLTCAVPERLLQCPPFVAERASERKLLLFASACCRRVWTTLLTNAFSADGTFHATNAVSRNAAQRYYRLQLP